MPTLWRAGEKDPLLQSDFHHSEPVLRQYLAAVLCSLISMATGCAGGWSSSAVPLFLAGEATDLGVMSKLTSDQVSWITSLINLGCMVGSLPAGQLSFQLGRRKFLLYLGVMLLFGWMLILLNFNNVELIYAGRFMCGMVAGSVCVTLSMYTNEISCDVIRGRSGACYDMMQVFGLLYVYCVSAIFSLFQTTVLCMVIPVIFLLTFSWMPESPVYLLFHGRQQEAIDCIKWFHGMHCDVDKHLARIQLVLLEGKEHHRSHESDKSSSASSPLTAVRKFFANLSPTTVKAYFIIQVLFMVQRSNGAPVITYYAQEVFAYANASISASLATIYLGLAQLVCTLCGCILIDHVGRRVLLLFSLSTMTASLGVFIWYLNIIDLGYDVKGRLGWLPVVSICTFVGAFRLGIGPIPWFLSSELILTEDQRWALPTIFFCAWGIAFLCSNTYLKLVEVLGYQNVFFTFMIICVIGLLHTIFFIPETKNKSRYQIQRELRSKATFYIEYDEL